MPRTLSRRSAPDDWGQQKIVDICDDGNNSWFRMLDWSLSITCPAQLSTMYQCLQMKVIVVALCKPLNTIDIDSTEQLLCPTCLELCFCKSTISPASTGTINSKAVGQVLLRYCELFIVSSDNINQICSTHQHPYVAPAVVQNSGEHCWTHTMNQHDVFINYRSAVEGRKTPISTVCFLSFLFLVLMIVWK